MTHRSTPRRLDFGWQQRPAPGLDREFGATITGTFVPDVTGDWTFGFRAIGRATVRLDGEVVFDVEPTTGGSFFNYGSPELFATVPLEAGVPCRIDIEYPSAPHPGWRGLVLGAEPPSSGDPIADAVRLAAARRRRARRRRDQRPVGDRGRGSYVDGPAGSPGRARRRGRRRQPQDRRGAELRFAGHDAVARPGRRGAADLVPWWAGRVGPRRRAVRRRRARRTSPGHVPTFARPHTCRALLSGRRRTRRVRRGSARRVSLVRTRAASSRCSRSVTGSDTRRSTSRRSACPDRRRLVST